MIDIALVMALQSAVSPGCAAGASSDTSGPQCATALSNQPQARAKAETKTATTTSFTPPELGNGDRLASGYYAERWVEEPRHEPASNDIFDALKAMPLAADGDVNLTLNGQLRYRFGHISNPGLVAGSKHEDDSAFRAYTGADLQLGPHFRVYGELASGGLTGYNNVNASSNRNKLFVQQLFGDAIYKLGSVDMGVRAGRQEFVDSLPQIISVIDNTNTHFVFDGERLWMNGERVRVDLFNLNYVTRGFGFFDDPTDHSKVYRGIVTSGILVDDRADNRRVLLDPFYIHTHQDSVKDGAITAPERRDHYGARLWGTFGKLAFDWSYDRQTGEAGGRAIRAYTIFTSQTIGLGNGPLKPRIGFHADYTSGGGFSNGVITRAASVSGTSVYASYSSFFGYSNLRYFSPMFSILPRPKLKIALEYEMICKTKRNDAVYNLAGASYANTQNALGMHVADVPRLYASYSVSKHFILTTRAEYAIARSVLKTSDHYNSLYFDQRLSFLF